MPLTPPSIGGGGGGGVFWAFFVIILLCAAGGGGYYLWKKKGGGGMPGLSYATHVDHNTSSHPLPSFGGLTATRAQTQPMAAGVTVNSAASAYTPPLAVAEPVGGPITSNA